MKGHRILVIEDEEHLATGLKLNLELEGYQVRICENGKSAAAALLKAPFDLILLDVMLPDTNGFDLCRRIRDSGNFVPVIMLTARGAPEDRVRGLESGADDYVPKPFALEELLARVRSILRRRDWEQYQQKESQTGTTFRFANAIVDFSRHEVRVDGKEIHLTQLELEILRYFANNPNRVISRQELLEQVWKLKNTTNTRTVDNFVSRLRKHFEQDPSKPRIFISVRSAGYRFALE